MKRWKAIYAMAQKAAPYLLLELLLPGGTLFALLLFLSQRGGKRFPIVSAAMDTIERMHDLWLPLVAPATVLAAGRRSDQWDGLEAMAMFPGR